MKNYDDLTSYLKIATDILFVKNPISTSMGVLFGIVVHGLLGVLSPLFQSLELVRISAISVFHFIALGILGFNVPSYINRHKISPKIESAINLIEEQLSKGNISKLEAKQQYRSLITQAVSDAKIKEEHQSATKSATSSTNAP